MLNIRLVLQKKIVDRYIETFKTWDKVAKLYQDNFMDLDLYNDTYDKFCELIAKENPSIFEIGCGPGNITKYLINKRPDCKIEAIDVSSKMIELAKINSPTAYFMVMDSRDIDKIKTKYDAVISGFCIPYLSDTDCIKLINDCSDLLPEKGILYLSFVDGEYNKSGYLIGSSGDRTYFYYHSLDFLANKLKSNSFEIINHFEKEYNKRDGSKEIHTIIIAEKIYS